MIDTLGPAQRILDYVPTYFDDRGWDLPERRYLANGNPMVVAMDDAHFVVGLENTRPGVNEASGRSGILSKGVGAAMVPRASYVVRVMRCVATVSDQGDLPTAAAITADGQRLLQDPGRLLTALFAWREDDMQPLNTNPPVTIGQVEAVGPMGGLAGWIVHITIGPVQ